MNHEVSAQPEWTWRFKVLVWSLAAAIVVVAWLFKQEVAHNSCEFQAFKDFDRLAAALFVLAWRFAEDELSRRLRQPVPVEVEV